MKAADAKYHDLGHIPTGLALFDHLLGGGVSIGCITEFYGKESTGKSTLALQVVAEAQKNKMPCLFCDTEYQFTPTFAKSLGVDCDALELTQNRIGEDTFDAIEEWVKGNKKGLVVLDSMGGILAREEAEKTAEGKSIGLQSRLMAAFCRKIIGLLAEQEIALIIVNHEVLNINTGAIGSSGGAKLAFHKRYSVRLTPVFGKTATRATDGSKKIKRVQAELKKEKGTDTHEGKKVELIYVAKEGFRNELPQVKRGRPKSTS